VMVDARDALDPGPQMAGAEWAGYIDSWRVEPAKASAAAKQAR